MKIFGTPLKSRIKMALAALQNNNVNRAKRILAAIEKDKGERPHLVLLRGLPGSGKSTLARRKYPDYKNFEADMFFEDASGNYNFDPSQIANAHKWCIMNTENAIRNGENVVVSNTFVRTWEMDPYFEIAKKYGARLTIETKKGNYGNVHGVPEEAIDSMKQNWEYYPDGDVDL